MRVSFRQGIVGYSQTGSVQTFLQQSGSYVSITTSNGPVSVTFADGAADYLHYESVDVNDAWGPFVSGTTYWMYWNINPLTGERTFGSTAVPPIVISSRPTPGSELEDQHWFDLSRNKMRVFTNGGWRDVIRVFAASYDSVNFTPLGNQALAPFAGTQVGLDNSVLSGRIIFDDTGKVIRKKNRELFTTEDQFFAAGSRLNTVRLEASVTYAPAIENVPVFHVVKYNEDGEVSLASYEDTNETIIAMAAEDTSIGDIGTVILSGTVENIAWSWTTVGDKLWVDTAGQLTLIDPNIADSIQHPIPNPHIAKVLSATSIIFEPSAGGGVGGGSTTIITNANPATPTVYGTVKTTTAVNTVVSDDDTRLTDARTPLAHAHAASDVSFNAFGDISGADVQAAIQELESEKLGLSGGTLTGILTLATSPIDPNEAATKNYVDGLVSGLQWKDPVHYVNLIGDDVTDPSTLTPDRSDVYIVPIGAIGAWAGKDGFVVVWDGAAWVDDIHGGALLSGHAAGTRFIIAGETSSTPSGTFAGKQNQIAVLDNPSTPTWSFISPSSQDAVFVDNEESLHAYHQYVYSAGDTAWIEFGGGNALEPGTNLTLIGNILNAKDYTDGGTIEAASLQGSIPSDFASTSHSHIIDALSDVNLTSITDGQVIAWDETTSMWINVDIPYDLAAQILGAPADGDTILRLNVVRQFELGTTGSIAEADIAATAVTVFDIQKNGSSIGNITFGAGSTTGVITITATTFYEGDVFKVVAPAIADATLADVGFTFKGRETLAVPVGYVFAGLDWENDSGATYPGQFTFESTLLRNPFGSNGGEANIQPGLLVTPNTPASLRTKIIIDVITLGQIEGDINSYMSTLRVFDAAGRQIANYDGIQPGTGLHEYVLDAPFNDGFDEPARVSTLLNFVFYEFTVSFA